MESQAKIIRHLIEGIHKNEKIVINKVDEVIENTQDIDEVKFQLKMLTSSQRETIVELTDKLKNLEVERQQLREKTHHTEFERLDSRLNSMHELMINTQADLTEKKETSEMYDWFKKQGPRY